MSAVPPPKTVGIIGLGLIGTSLGLALRHRLPSVHVLGVDVNAGAVSTARERGAIETGTSIAGLREADLVIVATPPAVVISVARQAAEMMKPQSVLMDVTSYKAVIVEALDRGLPRGVHFVGGHPMAGAEGQGAARADRDLLAGRPFVVTPTARTDPRALALVQDMVRQLGMVPVVMSPEAHDEAVAQVSHLPYLVAVAVVNAAGDGALKVGGPTMAAFVRVAGSPAELWAQITQANTPALMHALADFRRELDALERRLTDGPSLRIALARAEQRSLTAGGSP
ncbi:MAG TPA: prephenate dehydrogenase/arogenate dehydrogenase family protein [bacterium]|nr:prephenate dehydrogenase/arogenate dehydrogenase family protein [bacterium]